MREWEFNSGEIIFSLGGKSFGKDEVIIKGVSTIIEPKNNSILFASRAKWKDVYIDGLQNTEEAFIIVENELEYMFCDIAKKNQVVVVDRARLYFAKAVTMIVNKYNHQRKYTSEENNVTMGSNVSLGSNCVIEPNVFIDHDVIIGNNVIIKTGTRVRQNVTIEDNVIIGENCVIGGAGLGVEKDYDGKNIRIPHIGGVLIKENVEIGALTSIVSGTINPTVICDNCFIDDLNHIAHNCFIGKGSITTGCVEMGGSSRLGENVYVAPNSTIRNGIALGDNCFVGQASSVQHDFSEKTSLTGNPARVINRK